MDMDKLIANFFNQLKEAMEIGRAATINPAATEIRNIVVSGLGGSGIGGNLVCELVADELTVPMMVSKSYFLPNFVDQHTLVIISSYSGNTEETVSSFLQALENRAKIVCVSSNGKVEQMAREQGLDYVQIPGGMPPRSCLGYSFVQQLYILFKLGLITENFERGLQKAIDLLKNNEASIRRDAEKLASQLVEKLPIIYVPDSYEAVGVRFRQQLNENAKILCWHHVIPEMNHNELVGWRHKDDRLAAIFFRNDDDYEKIKQRIEINKEIISNYTANIIEVYSKGGSRIEKALYLIHFGDWVSYYLAVKRKMDAVEVKVIDYLKEELSKH